MLLRPGPISIEELQKVIGPVQLRSRALDSGALPSPGLLPRHYAPRTVVELFENQTSLWQRANELTSEKLGILVLGKPDGSQLSAVEMPTHAPEYAARLYDTLHQLDSRGLSRILIELPPDTPEWLAVRDRLLRAATRN